MARRREVERQVSEHVGFADSLLAEAASKRSQSMDLRARAFAAFDSFERDKGEDLGCRHSRR